jgi:hypothetical protein
MTSSGTYNYSLSNADLLIEAYSRVGVRRTSILAEHMKDGRNAINLAMVTFSNRQPNLWTSEEQTISLVASTAEYDLPARSVMILSCFIRTGSGATQQDRIAWPLSEFEYASLPNKTQEGFPTQFWFNRQIDPTITFYLVPDDALTYTAHLQIVRQLQDANLPGGETPDVPYRWIDALAAETAYRLSRIYAPDKEAMRKQDAAEAWAAAATNDVENVALNIVPALGGYFYR